MALSFDGFDLTTKVLDHGCGLVPKPLIFKYLLS